jgi:hypothetical protein
MRSTSSESRRTPGSNRCPFSSRNIRALHVGVSGEPTIFVGVGDISPRPRWASRCPSA